MHVTLQYFEGCPNWRIVDDRLRTLADELDLEITRQHIDTPEAAERHGFRGSPTILLDGADAFPPAEGPVGLTCRIYRTPAGPAGAPSLLQLREALTR